jgi:hypothetical protein
MSVTKAVFFLNATSFVTLSNIKAAANSSIDLKRAAASFFIATIVRWPALKRPTNGAA